MIPASAVSAPSSVLLIEDDLHIVRLLDTLLADQGFSVRSVRDGSVAQQMIASEPAPSLILLDIGLPWIDGLTLLRQIRASERWGACCVVMLTAQGGEAEIVRALQAGANDYIVKPFQPAEVIARIRRLLA